jgi:hypothetical protein
MTDTIIVGLLSLAGTCIGSLGGLRMTSYRIEQLEKKVDRHNNFAERIPVLEEKIESANDRIKNLEKHEEK